MIAVGQSTKVKDVEKIPGGPTNSRHTRSTMQSLYLLLRLMDVCLRDRELEVWPQVTAHIFGVHESICGVEPMEIIPQETSFAK